MNQAHEYAHL